MAKFDIYEMVTSRIIDSLEKGNVPWARPWQKAGLPMNLTTKRTYRGVNVFLTAIQNFDSPYWLTFKQVKTRKGTVIKGSKATPIVFWSMHEKENTNGEMKKFGFWKYYNVFNLTQIEGIEYPKHEAIPDFVEIVDCETITDTMPLAPEIVFGGDQAFYNREDDTVGLPNKKKFKGEPEYYSTKYHELVHSTGHTKRLNRRELMESKGILFAGTDYTNEELTAEIGASFLAAITGIGEKVIDNSSAYIAGWLKQLRNDKKFVMQAASKAQKAVDYILGKS